MNTIAQKHTDCQAPVWIDTEDYYPDPADEMDWGQEREDYWQDGGYTYAEAIPFDGGPASDTAAMDAEVLPYEEWIEIYQFELEEMAA